MAALSVAADVTHAELRAAFISQAMGTHPDCGGSDAAWKATLLAVEAVSFHVGTNGLEGRAPSAADAAMEVPLHLAASPLSPTTASSCTGSESGDSATAFLPMLHVLLRALSTDARHHVIANCMTEAQRRALEEWMIAQRPLAADLQSRTDQPSMLAESGVLPHYHHQHWESGHDDDNSRAPEEPIQPKLQYSDLRARTSSKSPRGIAKVGRCYLASVYAQWLEIRTPMRRTLKEALLDHIMLVDVKQHILRSSGEALLTDLGWDSLVRTASEHQCNASELRARVMLPAEFWIGTRLATPQQSLRAALRTSHRLRNHPSWMWSSALQGGEAVLHPAKLARATLPELWSGLRTEILAVSVQAGANRSSLEARLRRLEQQHRRAHGSFESRVLRRVGRLLRREHDMSQAAENKERKASRTIKRVLQFQQKERLVALRRRLREEKDMTMREILDRRMR